MGTTRIEKISIEGPDKDWKPFEEGDVALVVSVAPSQQMDVRGRWEAWLLAGVFRDRSREAGLPSVIVLDLEGVDAGRIDATDTEPISGAGSDDVRALTRLIHRASEEGGSHVDEFAILQPYGLAPAVMMKTAEPARFLKEQLPKFLKAFGDP